MTELTPVMTAQEVTEFLRAVFPKALDTMTVEALAAGEALIRLQAGEDSLRPGGTVSGPALFALADLAAYAAVLGHNGPQALAVTSNAHLNFLRRPTPGTLFCNARLLKLGKRLAVCDVLLTDEAGEVIAQGSLTYSLPPAG